MKNRVWLHLGLTLIIAVSLAGCGGGSNVGNEGNVGNVGNVGNENTNRTSESEPPTTYKENCMSCHGGELQGGMGPSLQKAGAKLTKDQLAVIITNGRDGMPSFKDRLSTEEIDNLAAWLAEKK
ncbi:c-type cytochrome [Paenibacillus herberti]|uniref:Cytochrome c-551 n=1 Tax=Paenibacillus herberti TaxID=1619309 RepID=A0A229P4F4_9BACL|nr:cytochrome c [Paenibacillus herberti]OXM16834.1 cytochrome c-551 [Paenibacillus herberti]